MKRIVLDGSRGANRVGMPRRMVCGSTSVSGREKLRSGVGGDVEVLSERNRLVVDQDGCTLDGKPLDASDFGEVLDRDVLASVAGPFALGYLLRNGDLLLARDAIGHRSLFYAVKDGEVHFATSMRVLAHAFAMTDPSLRDIAQFLSYAYVPGRNSLVRGLFELLPGEMLVSRSGVGIVSRRLFWDLPAEVREVRDEDEDRLLLRRKLEEEVFAAIPTGGPVAASLSGGIDSSLVVAIAGKRAPVHTFSITFGEGHRDELSFSGMVAEHVGTEHTIVELSPASIAAHLDETIFAMNKPNGDPLTVPNALLFRTMADCLGPVVALNGEGGDPCFGGPKNIPMVLTALYARGEHPHVEEQHYLRAHQKCFDDLGDLLSDDVLSEVRRAPLEEDLTPWFQDERWPSLVNRLMAINVRFKGGHHILPKVDALSRPYGVIARSPLFSRGLVELAFQIPADRKLRGSVEKYLLKEAVRDLLPEAIVERPKSGMMVPVEAWFQGPLLTLARERILEGLVPTKLFRRDTLEKLVSGKLRGLRPRHGVKIWLLVTLEAHMRGLTLCARRSPRGGGTTPDRHTT